MTPGYLSFQIFAMEVFRKDPDLFHRSMETASAHLEAAKREAPGPEVTAQEECIKTIYGLTGLMKLFGKEDIDDLPELDRKLMI
ncbi:hypothetical protein [Roseibium suaedae]|uniref:DUF1844 domain-containing protein n=1 Tax=Roseibium suaedae TaxID=735517 RepID=A0A1M7D811_9HYPH|nr:hypothetical protein [Roseibium suaedae]SHL75605.1 hypothetical protein SAMN05444272_1400 [Roseibium suaedae]